jgi:hypothetical protein
VAQVNGNPPATVTIGSGNPVTVTIRANQYLDLSHSVVITLAPGVTATGVQTTTGSATIVGGAVVWSGFVLQAGDQATATVTLASTTTIVGTGAPSIQGVTITAIDQSGMTVNYSAPGGGPTVDTLPAACGGASTQSSSACGGTRRFTPVAELTRRPL